MNEWTNELYIDIYYIRYIQILPVDPKGPWCRCKAAAAAAGASTCSRAGAAGHPTCTTDLEVQNQSIKQTWVRVHGMRICMRVYVSVLCVVQRLQQQ